MKTLYFSRIRRRISGYENAGLCVNMLADGKELQKYSRENAGGVIYTVDEVSGLLSIPRPTLYRYLREYSIPHLRRAGRISIPEDSFDRIREARDLHKEGLGTESVRRQLREGSAPDKGEMDRRLDNLNRALEGLRADIRGRPATEEVALSPTLRTILARQSLLMSAVFNLTEMVEDLLFASGKPRKPLIQDLEAREVLPERLAPDLLQIQGEVAAGTRTDTAAGHDSTGQTLAARSTDFGTLRRRRRRGVLAILAVLLLVACLAWTITALIGADNAKSPVPRVAETADEPPEAPSGTQIPDVSGRSLEAAVRIISRAGFEVTAIETEASPQAPETAIRTEPAAGIPAKPGTAVTLTMSSQPTGAASASATATATANATATSSASPSAGDAH
jgi:DNA-binding transcriptional MerR regulator